MNSSNEWSQLKKIVVGIANNAKMPSVDLSVRTVNHADILDSKDIKTGQYPQQVIDEANEDLETLTEFLRKENIEVARPIDNNPQYYNYCPRDSVLIFRDQSYATPMPIHCRKDEFLSFSHHLDNLHVLRADYNQENYNLNCVGNPNILALKEISPLFDAANILRANDNLLYLKSNSGNKKGAVLLQEILGDSCKVRILQDVYSYMHIDSTIALLREGLLLANPARIESRADLPEPFSQWDIIWCPEPTDIGHYPGICNASKWINMNLLSINENLVVLEEHQTALQQALKKWNIDSAMLPMRHQRTLGGGFHCVTLDLERKNDI